ncbi:MAG: hypothetical protein UZ01_00576, partial [Candidatus Brocadia sinica]
MAGRGRRTSRHEPDCSGGSSV